MGQKKKFRDMRIAVMLVIGGFLTYTSYACMDIIVGKKASKDGSVMTSHTVDGWYDGNIVVVPGKTFKEGAVADVYWNLNGEEAAPPKKIGEIPQVASTYTYFHSGYSNYNEHQLAIGETTIGQREELKSILGGKAIMTIEQLEVFALQRTKTARDAIRLIGSLAEKYGFLCSCADQGECLTIADTKEAWVFEIFGAGPLWDPSSKKPGAVWAAQRVPDEQLVCVSNIGKIREIYPEKTDQFIVSKHYKQYAIENKWYDPKSKKPFIWQEAYAPRLGDWALASEWVRIRQYLVYKTAAPSIEWDPNAEIGTYPFSIKPEKKWGVEDIIAMQRSTLRGTPFDMEADPAWLVPDKDGKMVKSPFATAFTDGETRKLLNVTYHRPAARQGCSYGFVSQSRDWLPNPVGGVLWFYYDNPHMSVHVPIYAGVNSIPQSWQNFDRNKFTRASARWAFMLADDLVNRRYQDAIKVLIPVQDSLQKMFLNEQAKIDDEALKLYKKDPQEAMKYVTEYSNGCMDKSEKAYWELNDLLISKFTNNTGLTP